MIKRLLVICFLVALGATSGVTAQPCCGVTISGSGASVQISTSSTPVNWIQMVAPSGNMANAYWDFSTATTANSGILPPGAGQFLPPKGRGGYDLAGTYVYVAMGDTLRVAWNQEP